MRRNPWSILAIASVLLLSMLPAIAAAEDPTFVSGNSDCTSVGSVAGNTLTILDPVVDGTYTGSDGSQITLSNTTRRAFDFATNGALVFDVIVKGSGSNWYDYDGGSGAVRSDTDLRIPNGNKLNLVHFCYAGNNPPVANHDSASGNEDTTITGNVLTNDTDADGDALTAIKVGDPANGSVTLSANGSFSYTPNANFNGTDSFTYKANDGSADSNTATVTITVNAINDPPVATNDSAQV
ncbi:MAG TPA: cadherin-like domain-containing protein, partial [Acidimicrobiia bacterium]|nr:cadherin-like domain-containing protein [Acidimicrobiia bacterium]